MEAGGNKVGPKRDDLLEREFEMEVREHLSELDGDVVDLTVDRPETEPVVTEAAEDVSASVEAPAAASEDDVVVTEQSSARSFAFASDRRVLPLSILAGVLPRHARVDVADGMLAVRFGIWRLRTSLANVVSAEVTGPYALVKVAGPPRLSLRDSGLTFATTTARGVCISFAEPVKADPVDLRAHSALTVTVADPEGLVAALS